LSDDRGDWGIEDKKWCGIGKAPDTCFALPLGYPCCEACEIVYTVDRGNWGIENKNWWGIKDSCVKKDDLVK